jgi:drug/metabolite transporter (DMT)-like permease
MAIGFALLAAMLFGAATPASKLLVGRLTPFQLAGLLYLGAALAMAPVVARRRVGVRLDRANRARLLGMVVFGGCLAPVLLLAALRSAPAGSVALLLNLEIAATAVLGAVWFAEPLGRRGWCGVGGIVVAGALLTGGSWPGVAAGLLVAAGCLCWGLDNQLTALIDGMTPEHATFWKGTVAGGVNFTIGVAIAPLKASGPEIAAALVVGALSYGVSIALYIRAAQHLGAVRAQALFASAPFLGAALSFVVLGEAATPLMLVAAAVLLGSVFALFGDAHAHRHRHAALEHVHPHRHDDGHHTHAHPGVAPSTYHSHPHRHDSIEHAHPHWPDLHHRHQH